MIMMYSGLKVIKKLFPFDQIWFYEAQDGANIHTARSKIDRTVAIFKVKEPFSNGHDRK